MHVLLLLLQGFHKILKKHDKMLPESPCQQFYIAHLHHQPWVQASASTFENPIVPNTAPPW
jgi:SPX domain protein involved in polyphosphate accumulation